jgi:hypothetical protein
MSSAQRSQLLCEASRTLASIAALRLPGSHRKQAQHGTAVGRGHRSVLAAYSPRKLLPASADITDQPQPMSKLGGISCESIPIQLSASQTAPVQNAPAINIRPATITSYGLSLCTAQPHANTDTTNNPDATFATDKVRFTTILICLEVSCLTPPTIPLEFLRYPANAPAAVWQPKANTHNVPCDSYQRKVNFTKVMISITSVVQISDISAYQSLKC